MSHMANTQVSLWVDDETLEMAQIVANSEDRKRAYVLNRWLERGRVEQCGDGVRPSGDSEKNREVSATGEAHLNGGPVPVFGLGQYSVRGGGDLSVVGVNHEEIDRALEGAPKEIEERLNKVVLENHPLADSGFQTLRPPFDEPTKQFLENSGFDPAHVEKVSKLATTDQIYKRLADNLEAQKEPLVIDDAAATEFFKNVEPPKVPEEHYVNLKLLQEVSERLTGADPALVMEMNKATSPTSKRTATAAGRDQKVDVPKVAKAISKKIAEVSASTVSQIEKSAHPKIGEKCPHGWANWLQCDKCNAKLAENEL